MGLNTDYLRRTFLVAEGVGGDLERVTDEVAAKSFAFLGYYPTMNTRTSGALARDVLGWQPRRPSIVEEFRRGTYQYHLHERRAETSAAPN